MRKPALAATLVLAIPALSSAGPCVPDSLASYIALGSGGCDVGGATFFDFAAGASFFGGAAIDPALILVVPSALAAGPQLDFLLSASVAAGDVAGAAIGFTGTGLPFLGATLSMTGGQAAGDGAVTAVEDLCLGDVFVSDPSFCFGSSTETLIVAADSLGATGPDGRSFAPTSFFDVFVDITIDGGLAGSAALDGQVTSAFTTTAPIPEPTTLVLAGSGLVGLLWTKRRRRAANP